MVILFQEIPNFRMMILTAVAWSKTLELIREIQKSKGYRIYLGLGEEVAVL